MQQLQLVAIAGKGYNGYRNVFHSTFLYGPNPPSNYY